MTKIGYNDIAGVVILYNSSIEVLDNITTYINQIKKLYVVDNSTHQNIKLISAIKSRCSHLHYHSLNGNKGIATALNWAARQAIQDGFSVLLTMDDDTAVPIDMISEMINFWNDYSKPIGILSGVHHDRPHKETYRCVLYTLTSGNLLNLIAYKKVGGFIDDLFIDHVDHEYGFRLNSNGYLVVELPTVNLKHKLGYSQQVKIGTWIVRSYGTNSPIRLYYYARNGIYISKLYFYQHPNFAWMFTKEMTRRWIKTLLLDKNRFFRMKMLLRGMKHGWKGHLGEYDGN